MNKIKWISIGVVGSLFAVSHLGMIGYIASKKDEPKLPNLNIPVGPYTSYKASVTDDSYVISYSANDPKTAYITKDIKEKGGGDANISKKDMEFLIAKAAETAPAQTIRIESAPIKITPDSK